MVEKGRGEIIFFLTEKGRGEMRKWKGPKSMTITR